MGRRVLFVCTKNAVRSPMAKAIAENLLDAGDLRSIHVDSAGIDPGNIDGFAIATMAEYGLNIQSHESKDLQEFTQADFDLLITLSSVAASYVDAHFGINAEKIEHWHVSDPSLVEGNRDQRLEAYRQLSKSLESKILNRFGTSSQFS